MHTIRRLSLGLRALLAAGMLAALTTHAAETDISQVPPSVKNTLPPNIMFTLDDSGSMFWEVVPDYTLSANPSFLAVMYLFPQVGILSSDGSRRNLPVYSGANEYDPRFYPLVDADPANSDARFFRSAAGNPLFYDPRIRYEPWANADGTSSWAAATPTAADRNPARPNADLKVDLTANMTGYTRNKLVDGAVQSFSTEQEVTLYPATYFVYKGTGTLTRSGDTNVAGNFDHIEIRPGNTYTKYPARSDCGSTCSYEQELQNFANWFSYYRSRLLAARAGVGKAFSQQREELRIGYATINTFGATVDGQTADTIVRGVRPFAGSDRSEFFDLLYTRNVPNGSTPLRSASDNVGLYFQRSDSKSPWRKDIAGSSASVEYSCYRNFHILMTDGYWSDDDATSHGDVDGTAGPTTHQHADRTDLSYRYEPVPPFSDRASTGATGYAGTLADVAMHHWKADLRSDLANNVPTDPRNPAFWQHLSTYTIGFGLTGLLSQTQVSAALSGASLPTDWPGWPDPNENELAKLDDLAHAAVNGRGSFFNTSKPDVFARELSRMLDSINATLSAASASAVSNPNVTSSDRTTYETSYLPGEWSGQLKAFELDTSTGAPTTTSPWSSPTMEQLDLRTSSSRRIGTHDGTDGVAFKAGSGGLQGTALSQLQLPSGTDNAAAVIEYLRGDRSGETSTPPAFKLRSHLLGAIIHSEPFLVRPPDRAYSDTGYASFRTANASRSRMLYVGANDGMLHAFDAQTGAEEWAYVPGLLLPRIKNLADPSAPFQATVDGFITVGDADLGRTQGGTGTDWRTMLVSGLGRGGKGFFALDITTPTAATDSAVADKVLWEFPASGSTDAANVGYSFSRPILVKHELVANDGTRSGAGWVVLVSSGYNNGGSGDGKGYLYVLNARTGAVIRAIGTNVGSATDPSGLGQISAWVDDDNTDNSVRWVYGGDLKGNLWRFDLTAADPSSWTVTKLASLTDGSNPQPITVAPELARIKQSSSVVNVVAVGTGRYLGDKDVPGTPNASSDATQTQSFYVIKDAIDTSRRYSAVDRSSLESRTLSTLGDGKRGLSETMTAIDWAQDAGWYVDLNLSGERVNADPFIAHTTVTFVTNVPSADPCKPGGSSHLFQFDLVSGSYALGPNNLSHVSTPLGNALATRPVLVKLPSGKVVALIRKSDGSTTVREVEVPVSGGSIRRLSWRELNYR